MGIDPAAFWGPEGAKNPALTDTMVARAQRELGVKLPTRFIELLRIKNGGSTRGFVCPTKERTYGDDYVPLGSLFGIGSTEDDGDGYNVLTSQDMIEVWGLPPKQVLLMGEGHWWLSLDYRASKQPRVVYIDVDERREVVVSESFDHFFAALLPKAAVDDTGAKLKPTGQRSLQ